MATGSVKVAVDLRALQRLQQQPQVVMRELDLPLREAARRALDISLFLVPTESGELRDSAFLDGPRLNLGRQLSTTWTAGYMHPAAGPIHEGFHWGEQTQPPPAFLRTAFRGTRGRVRKAVASQLASTLARLFPRK